MISKAALADQESTTAEDCFSQKPCPFCGTPKWEVLKELKSIVPFNRLGSDIPAAMATCVTCGYIVLVDASKIGISR